MAGPPAAAASAAEPSTYRLTFDPSPHRIRVEFNGVTVADSNAAMVLNETRHPPILYFPRADVRMDLLERTEHRTHCPIKGNASYWSIVVEERRAENAVWSYEQPLEDAAPIRGYLAFYWSEMDAWYESEKEVKVRVPELDAGGFANPLAAWLMREAWEASSAAELVGRLGRCLVEAGVPLLRLMVVIRTLHPLLVGNGYRWWRTSGEVEESELPHSMLTDPDYLHSPLLPIFEGAGGIRRRLEDPDAPLDFPILRELRGQGITDYVAMPLVFSDGQINIIALGADNPGGFTTGHLGHIYEILGTLSRLFEVHALRQRSITLLDTYLGRQSGRRVLEGRIKRGDGDDIHAVIWFCDLRDSTTLADSMPRKAFLELLNDYLETMAGAVLEHGGEVLRFIGDAALAIFPIEKAATGGAPLTGPEPAADACRRAVSAARAARARMAERNAAREAAGHPALDFGIALHLGDLTYGNIGAATRLEFTVIGSAANEAARIEALCKTLGERVLASEAFARLHPEGFSTRGRFALRGIERPYEIFALEE